MNLIFTTIFILLISLSSLAQQLKWNYLDESVKESIGAIVNNSKENLPFFLQPQPLYEKQIVPFDGLQNDFYVRAVAVSDSFFFVSSLRYSNHVENAVYIYRFENNDYVFQYKIHPSESQPGIQGELFGSRLLYQDGQLFVGAQNKKIIGNWTTGVVYLFEYENYKWVEKQVIIPPIQD